MWYQSASQITEYNVNTSCIKLIRKMYHSKRNSKNSRMRGIDEYLSFEQEAANEPETEDVTDVPDQGLKIAQETTKQPKGKRVLTAEETSKFEKRTRRKLNVESPTSQAAPGPKLMQEAIQSGHKIFEAEKVPQIRPEPEEEAEESSVAGLPHQPGLRTTGPALTGATSYHPPNEEGGDESETGDAESAPRTIPSIQPIAEGSTRVGTEKASGSFSSSALILMPDAHKASPTTGLLPTAEHSSESPEKVSYGSYGSWEDPPPPSPGKASAYIPASPQGSPVRKTTPSPDRPRDIILHPGPTVTTTTLVITPPPAKPAPLKISLLPDQEMRIVSSTSAELLTVPPSSPSTLGISVPSSTPSPAFSTAVIPVATTSVTTSSFPATSPNLMNVPDFFQTFIEQLEQVMKLSVKTIVSGQRDFGSLRPVLMNCLNNIKCLGDDECYRRCLEALSRLEAGVKAFQDLRCTDLDSRIESSFAQVRSQALHHHEVVQKSLNDKELEAESLKARREQLQNELTSATFAMKTTQNAIAKLQAELAKQEADVHNLTNKSVEAEDAYHKGIQALEKAKEEADAAILDEEALKKETAARVRALHAEALADAKSQLESVTLRGSLI